MNTDYWKSTEVQPDIDTWLGFWEGCVHCACDHGCNQWIEEQNARAALIMRAMRLGSKKSVLDKLVQIPLDKANRIWFWIAARESRLLNDAMRKDDKVKTNWLSKDSEFQRTKDKLRSKRTK